MQPGVAAHLMLFHVLDVVERAVVAKHCEAKLPLPLARFPAAKLCDSMRWLSRLLGRRCEQRAAVVGGRHCYACKRLTAPGLHAIL